MKRRKEKTGGPPPDRFNGGVKGPSDGAWYYVWLKPDWRLFVFKASEYGNRGHDKLWAEYVAPLVAAHYGIAAGSAAFRRLQDAYAGMPRGRVTLVGDVWFFHHGNDFPVDPGSAAKTLPTRFGLVMAAIHGRTRLVFDEHETMIDDDRAILEDLLGPVPPPGFRESCHESDGPA